MAQLKLDIAFKVNIERLRRHRHQRNKRKRAQRKALQHGLARSFEAVLGKVLRRQAGAESIIIPAQ